MPLSNPSRLEKLKIRAYSDRERTRPVRVFEAMFNPTSFSQEWEIAYGKDQGIGSSGKPVDFASSRPSQLQLELLLDGTGVDAMGLRSTSIKPVPQRVNDFLDTAYELNGSIHEPNFLVVEWGDHLAFSCRLLRAKVAYSSFDRGGNPLRATIDVTVIHDDTADKLMARERKSSPDVTHTRVVKGGDTLPLLTRDVYGSAEHYLFVARANRLDDFRNLVPGQELAFPPLEV